MFNSWESYRQQILRHFPRDSFFQQPQLWNSSSGHHWKDFSHDFSLQFWTGQRLHSQNVMYYINSVFNIPVLQLMQLASHLPRTLKTPTNWSWIPITPFFSMSHMVFSCCQRTKSHFLDGSSWECFFVGVRYGTPHQKMKFDWLD